MSTYAQLVPFNYSAVTYPLPMELAIEACHEITMQQVQKLLKGLESKL